MALGEVKTFSQLDEKKKELIIEMLLERMGLQIIDVEEDLRRFERVQLVGRRDGMGTQERVVI